MFDCYIGDVFIPLLISQTSGPGAANGGVEETNPATGNREQATPKQANQIEEPETKYVSLILLFCCCILQ